MQFLLLWFLVSTAVALKTPTLCSSGKQVEFVCNVIKPVNAADSYTQPPTLGDTITIGTRGQADFIKTIKAVEILRNSLRNQAYAKALETKNYKWFQAISKVEGQLNEAAAGTQKLVSSVVSGLTNLQASIDKTVTANVNKVEQAVSDANKVLSEEIDKKELDYLYQEYNATVSDCQQKVSNQVELLQNRTNKAMEKSYDSLVDLTDQVGLCIQNNEIAGKCVRSIQTKLNAVRSLGRSSQSEAKKFEDAGKKSFEKDACLSRALRAMENSVKTVLKASPQVSSTTASSSASSASSNTSSDDSSTQTNTSSSE